MAVKPGYKLTEVGVIPEEWVVKPFGALFAFRNGVNADKNSYGQGVRFINVLEPITYSHIHGPEIQGQVTLPESVSVSYEVRRGDVLFNRTSETQEEVGLAATYLGSERVVFGGFVIRGRPTNGNLDPVYSGYALRAPFIRSQIIPMGQGAIRANIGQSNLGLVIAPLPPLSEQRAIATALSDVDALLGALERLIVKKRDLKQAAMQHLLTGQTRLPGFHGEWDVRRLGDIADVIDPHPSHRAPEEVTNGVPFVGIGDLDQSGNIMGRRVRLVSPKVLEEHALRYDLKDELIGLGRVASIGKVVSLKIFSDGYAISPTLGVIRGREVKRSYLLYALKSRFVTEQFTKIMSGSTRSSVGMEVLRELHIKTPPTEQEQTAIAAVLTDMDSELAALEQRLAKTSGLKQGMMQELLTGRTRLL